MKLNIIPTILLLVVSLSTDAKTVALKDLFDLSLEELLNVSIGSLTSTDVKRVPASITIITQQDIIDVGARHLDELFEIMVPNLQLVRHNFGPQHIGIRGLINDRENSYLFVVNGRTLNQKSKLGVTMERDLPMLGDIRKIEIIRGPGSAVYGSGAISGVVSITTLKGSDFSGTEVIVKQGAIERFGSYEIRHSRQLFGDSGPSLMAYYGVSDYSGVRSEDSPYITSVNTQVDGEPYLVAGQPVPYDSVNSRGSTDGNLLHKLHLQLDGDNYTTWLRYSKGGYQVNNEHPRDGERFMRGRRRSIENAYQQLTLVIETTKALANDDELFMSFGYGLLDASRNDGPYSGDIYAPDTTPTTTTEDITERRFISYREDEYSGKIIYRKENSSTKQAYGVEAFYDILGLPSLGSPDIDATTNGIYSDGTRRTPDELLANGNWGVLSYAGFGEIQWMIDDNWILFSGARFDKHDYTDWYFSPRLSLIYVQSDEQIWKALYNQSIKRAGEFELRQAHLDGYEAVEEDIKSFELSYSNSQQEYFTYQGSLFRQEVEFFSFSSTLLGNLPIGVLRTWGGEFEILYEQDDHKLSVSHSYTKLIDIREANGSQYITAQAYGYGNDLNTWSNNITKLFYKWQIKPTWLYTASARLYWGFKGAQDYGDYNNDRGGDNQDRFGYDTRGKAFNGNYYLNMGLHKKVSDKLDIALNAYNILGWIDKDYNKRNYIKRFSDYRPEAAAVALTVNFKF